ncbi:MAG: hypothetical protein ACRC35_00045 [Angustibacter sp.]
MGRLIMADTLIPILTLLLGAGLSYLMANRNQANEIRRRYRTEYLLGAYRNIERTTNRKLTNAAAISLESAIAEVNMFGTAKHQKIAKELQVAMAKHQTASFNPLLDVLRTDIRREFGLDRGIAEVAYFRVGPRAGEQ